MTQKEPLPKQVGIHSNSGGNITIGDSTINIAGRDIINASPYVMEQRETWMWYRREVYAPLHRELKSIQHVLAQAHQGCDPYPTGLALQLWPMFRSDVLYSTAFTMKARNLLDALEKLVDDYNQAVEDLYPIIEEILCKALIPPLQKETQQKSYKLWKKGNPREHSSWFEWIELNTERRGDSLAHRGEQAVRWWLRPPLSTFGWLLANNPERAAQDIYEAHLQEGITPPDPCESSIWGEAPSGGSIEAMMWAIEIKAGSVNWCKPILEKVLILIARHRQKVEHLDRLEREEERYVNWGDMKEFTTYSFLIQFKQAQKELYESLEAITTDLENAILQNWRLNEEVTPLF